MKHLNYQSGLIKLVALIVVLVLIISYFGINIQKIAESEAGRANFAYIWSICQQIGNWLLDLYQKYLASYLDPIWAYLPKSLVK